MKATYFLIGFLFLTVLSFSTIVQATSYDIGVEEDDEIIWQCNTCDEDRMEDIWGKDWDSSGDFEDLEQGKKAKWEITNVDDEKVLGYDYLILEYDAWDWKSGDKWGKRDDEVTSGRLEDPGDYADNLKPSSPWYWIPAPVDKYLDEIDFDKDIDVEGTKVTIDVDEDEYGSGTPDEDVKYIGEYDNAKGILSNLKLLDSDDKIVAEIALQGIPGYDLPILLGLTAIFSIGIIYLMKRKR